jgi:tRNA(Arg) A34 adenosine deaminase TadA
MAQYVGEMDSARRYMDSVYRRAGVFDGYMHCAALLRRNALAGYGMNMRHGGKRGIHAEMNALSKVACKKRRRLVCNLLVIRITPGGTKLGESRPCKDCIMSMYYHERVKIVNVLYSTKQGTICAEKLTKMMETLDTAHETVDKSCR